MCKVCHVSSAHNRYDARILERECVSLAQNGYDTYFVVNDKLNDERYKDVSIKSTQYHSKNRIGRIVVGICKVYKLALKIDADFYHLHDPELLLIAGRLKKKGKKVIFDSHESYYDQIQHKSYLPQRLRKGIANIYYRFETSVVKKIDGVIVPAMIGGKNIFAGRASRVAFVNNVPKLEEIPAVLKRDVKREGICYTGSLTYNRGIWHLMKAASIADVPLHLAGEFSPESFQKELMQETDSAVIQYAGRLGRNEIYQLYEKCAIGMSTLLDVGQYSKLGNFPTKVYEYMAMEMPVILSDFPYNRKMVEKYQFGLLVRPDKPKDIAEKIKYLLENPSEMKRLGENGRKLILETMNWSIEEKKLLQMYKALEV